MFCFFSSTNDSNNTSAVAARISDLDLITRRTILELEGEECFNHLEEYSDGTTERGKNLRSAIAEKFNFSSLEFRTLAGIIESIGLPPCKLCTYCWSGKE
jgi:amidophosphoribosyltransferase